MKEVKEGWEPSECQKRKPRSGADQKVPRLEGTLEGCRNAQTHFQLPRVSPAQHLPAPLISLLHLFLRLSGLNNLTLQLNLITR